MSGAWQLLKHVQPGGGGEGGGGTASASATNHIGLGAALKVFAAAASPAACGDRHIDL